jgi:hypothetical protein
LEKFNILSRLIRIMDHSQAKEAAQQLYASKPQNINDDHSEKVREQLQSWKAFRDATAQAGTGPAFTLIKEWIEEKKVQGEEAAELVASLAKTIRVPTEQLMMEFFKMATSSNVQKQQHLNSTALLSLTLFLNRAQVNNQSAYNYYPILAYGRLADKDNKIVTRDVIPYLNHQLKRAVDEEDSKKIQLFVRALGNLGHPAILNVLEPYLEGKYQVTQFQRLAMVVSLDKLVQNYPKLSRNILFKIYQNIGEGHEVRCAAVFQLIRTTPPAAMLQRMAEFTHHDPSKHVSSAVKSVLTSAAQLTNEEYSDLSNNAAAAVPMLNPKILGMQYSKSLLRDFAAEELNLAYGAQLSYIGSTDNLMPQAIFYRLQKNLGGYRNMYVEVSIFFVLLNTCNYLIFYQTICSTTPWFPALIV